MMNILNTIFGTQSFGLYITDSYIQAVKINGDSNSAHITGTSHLPLEKGIVDNGEILNKEQLAAAIKQLLSEAKPSAIKDKNCHIVVPEQQVFEFETAISPETLTKEKIDQIVRENIPLVFSELEYVYRVDQVAKTINIFAVKKNIINDYASFLANDCNLESVSIEPESVSLLRVLKKDFDAHAIMLFGKDDKIYWLELDKNNVAESGAIRVTDLGVNYENLINELKKCSTSPINEIIIGEEIMKNQEIEKIIKQNFPDASVLKEMYRIGNTDYKWATGLALNSIETFQNSQMNFLKPA